jgi:hypothetical protein
MANQERRRGRWTRGREKALMTAVGMLIVVLSKRRQHAAKHERNEMFQRHDADFSAALPCVNVAYWHLADMATPLADVSLG